MFVLLAFFEIEHTMKQLTEEQVLQKLTSLCARGEHCQREMLDKMRRWEIEEEVQASVMAYLVGEGFIDEERYARAFIEEKTKFNGWGPRKVEQALRMKGIPSSIYAPLIKELPSDDRLETLRPIIENKRKTVTGKNDYDIRCKLIRFALSRGFEMDDILKVLGE